VGRHPKSAEVRGRFWTARASGATLREAAQAAGVSRTAGHYWLTESGGVRPRAKAPRPPLRLSLAEREEISRGLGERRSVDLDRRQTGTLRLLGVPGGPAQRHAGGVPGSPSRSDGPGEDQASPLGQARHQRSPEGVENSDPSSRSRVVLVDEPAEDVSAANLAMSGLGYVGRGRIWRREVKTTMRTMRVVVRYVCV